MHQPKSPFTLGRIAFLSMLGLVGFVYAGLVLFREKPQPVLPQPDRNFVEEAEKYLVDNKAEKLSGPLQKILEDDEKPILKTHEHAFVGKKLDDFELKDVDNKAWKLSDRLPKGPIVLIFYNGYNCDHCVAQLIDIKKHLDYYRELGAEIVAVSPDKPEFTQQQYKKYGSFPFPVLSDPDNKLSERFKLYNRADEDLAHGTFVIDKQGVVRFANFGDRPFTSNRTLMHHLAEIRGK